MERFYDIVAIAGAMIGSALVASNSGYAVLGYVFYLFGAAASVKILITKGVPSLLIVNIYFVVINIIGIIRFMPH